MTKRLGVVALAIICLPQAAAAFVDYDGDNGYWYGYSDTLHGDDGDAPDFDQYRPLSSGATPLEATYGSSGRVGPIAIGFKFDFYGEVFDQLYVVPGGAISFGSAGFRSELPHVIPDEASPNGYVAAGWSAFNLWDTKIRYATRGRPGERQFVVEWSHQLSPGTTTVVSQVVLDERFSDVLVHLVQTEGWNQRLLVGLESPGGDLGLAAYDGVPRDQPLSEYSAIFSPYLTQPRLVVAQGELSVPEGGVVEVSVEVADRQDDVVALRWDLDGDGDFDDGEGTPITVSAGGLNGPDIMTVYVAAEDRAGHRRELPVEIAIENAPPRFVNQPETDLWRGQEWSYVPELEDPGGDEVTIEVLKRPRTMVVRADGSLWWTPQASDAGRHSVVLRATDADDDPEVQGDGESSLEFTLSVIDNSPPTRPVIIQPEPRSTVATLRPTFVVETPTDPDEDSLQLVFEVDVDNTFESPELIASGPLPVSVGRTGWTCPTVLRDGQQYWWRVAAHDAYHQGPAARGTFLVQLPPGALGGETESGDDSSQMVGLKGCSCQAGPGGERGSLVFVVCVVSGLLLLRRRRQA